MSDVDKKIASHVLEFIDDGITLQVGVGGVANAVGFSLDLFKDIGIQIEIMTNSMIALAQKGVITVKQRTMRPGEITIGFGLSSAALYEFMDRNPAIRILPIRYINDPNVVGQNDKFISINATLMTDLTGQACSESPEFDQFSGTGGQPDFVRGTGLSKGGKRFLCLPSTAQAKDGSIVSRITVTLLRGAVVTTPRSEAQYFVTKYWAADVRNRCIRERVEAMIKIARPQFRNQLSAEAPTVGLIARNERIAIE